ncbi:MAG TPA: class II fructose-bisphosphate aldolase [Gemmatimonadaceae bacterium]|jgi:fructose/tagatose bisphosphate aldolase|nr:class II fructose-bisphosphate aldolase [Gemmatimonadaceae bacterium]
MPDSLAKLDTLYGSAVNVAGGRVTVANQAPLATAATDALARAAVFGEGHEREHARWLLWELGQAVGVRPASIQDLYMARGRGECHGFTVPAINVRGMAYDMARSIFRTAIRMKAGAFILEIARSEIAYTDQRPAEYVAVMLAAALREGFRGPVFIQGDHFQVNARKFAVDRDAEVDGVKQLATEAVHAGFFNIDIDTSTLVDLSKSTLDEQQRLNYEVGADILKHVRSLEPAGVTISVGGEIGEVGTANSTVEELEAYMDGFLAAAPKGMVGVSKISVQSGTSHGGVVLADGSIADVKLDLDTLERLSKVARDHYGLAGAVQHGASTLPDSAFHNFPKRETAEIHLATNFQNMLYDHVPVALRDEIYGWLTANMAGERKATDSDEQFFYKTRKKALGPFKRKFWDLDEHARTALATAYDQKFAFLFEQLAIGNTAQVVAQHVTAPTIHRAMPDGAVAAVAAAPDDADAGE